MPPSGILATLASYLVVSDTVSYRFGDKLKKNVEMPHTYQDALALAQNSFEELHGAPPGSLEIFLERDGEIRNLLLLNEALWGELSDSREPYYDTGSVIYVHINRHIWRDGPSGVKPICHVGCWYRPLEEKGGAYGVAMGEPATKERAFQMFREFSEDSAHRELVEEEMAEYTKLMMMAGPGLLNVLR